MPNKSHDYVYDKVSGPPDYNCSICKLPYGSVWHTNLDRGVTRLLQGMGWRRD